MPTKVSILVYAGNPLDYTKYRHAGLFFEFPSGRGTVLHITGAPGIFEFQAYENYDPEQSQKLVGRFLVAEIPDTISEQSIRDVVSRTSVRNELTDGDWNCQNWVGDALTRLVDRGYVGASQREAAVDNMVDACLQAADE